jgi:serine racemase
VQVRDLVDGVVVITDEQIVAAMQLVFERMKLVVEPSGAAGLAAVLAPDFGSMVKAARAAVGGRAQGDGAAAAAAADVPLNIGIILCGGNLDFESKGFFKLATWLAQA